MNVKSSNLSTDATGIIWARESNRHDKNEYTLDAQIETGRAQAERDGVAIQYTFREKFSGVDLWQMPELTRLRGILQATPGRKIIYCHAQDRLVRGEEGEDIFWLLVEFRRYGAEVRFHLNPVDLSSIAGKIQVLIAGNEASNEIAKIHDRVWTRGRLKRMKQGKISNAGPQKYGFRRIRETGKAVIEDAEAIIVRRIAGLIEQGYGLRKTAEILNSDGISSPRGKLWSAFTVRGFFLDPAYKGEGYGWRYSKQKKGPLTIRAPEDWIKLAEDAYPVIIEPERWDRINALIQRNKGDHARNEERFFLLRGLVFCACGHRCYPIHQGQSKYGKRYYYYFCGQQNKERRQKLPPTCTMKMASAEKLEAEVWQQTVALLANHDRRAKIIQIALPIQNEHSADDLARLEKVAQQKLGEVKRLAGRLRQASELIAAHIEQEMESAENQRRLIEHRIAEMRENLRRQDARDDAPEIDLNIAPPEQRRRILEALSIRVTLTEDGFTLFSPVMNALLEAEQAAEEKRATA